MAGAGMQVTYSEMEAAAGRLEAQRALIEQELKKAQAQVTTLVSGGFVTRHASGKFDTASQQFVRGATDVMQGLGDLAKYLKQTSSALEQADRDLAARIRLG